MRRPINTVNGFYKDPNLHWSAQDALNVIPKMAEQGGTRTVSELLDAPGLRPYVWLGINAGDTFTAAGPGRGMRVVDGRLYVVAGTKLWQVTPSGVSIPLGTIPGVGRVSMAHNQRGNGNELAIDNGSARYVYNTQTQVLTKVTDSSFPGSIKAFFIDGYIGYVEPMGRYWGHSDLSDALSYQAFDAYEAEGQPDRIVTGNVNDREVQIFGAETVELYVNAPSGSGAAPFQRASNTIYPYGCAARDSVVNVGGLTVFLDDKRCVRVLAPGYNDPISTSVIESMLQACTPAQIAAAYAYSMESEGARIYYLTVPGQFTFGYDFTSGQWHRRASFGQDYLAVADMVLWSGKWIALDSMEGKLYEMRWHDYPFDGSDELVREWATGCIHADQNLVRLDSVELLFGCGGQLYTPIDFPEQPAGPAISGDAQNGSVGIAYAGYTYTVTAGDAAIASVQVISGAVPDGLVFDPVGAIEAGSPTVPGTFTFTLRVTDVNGLFSTLSDTVYIQQVLLATGEDALDDPVVLRVPDSLDWTAPYGTFPMDLSIATEMLGIPGRGLAWNVNLMAKTDNYGTSWEMTAANLGGNGGARKGAYKDGLLLIAGGNSTMHKSSDSGSTTSAVTGSPNSNWLAWAGDRLISAYNGHTTLRYSDSTAAQFIANTQSFSTGGTHGLDLGGTAAVCAFAGCWMLGARIGTKPALAITEDGGSITNVTFSGAVNGYVSAIVGAEVEGEEIWVIATTAGEMFWSDDRFQTYHACVITGGTPITVCGIFDGIRYVFAGAIPTDYVATSLDGKNFAVNTNTSIVGGITAMCTVPPP